MRRSGFPKPPDPAEVDFEIYRRSFGLFLRRFWPVVVPNELKAGWYIDALVEHLEALYRGEIMRLLVNMPFRLGKSVISNVLFPAWSWLDNPSLRFFSASHSLTYATRDTRFSRQVINSPEYQSLLMDPRTRKPRWVMTGDQNQKSRYENSLKGFRFATHVGSGTGEGGEFLLCVAGETLIATDQGQIPIRRIVEDRLPVRVLGPSGEWQEIEAYERNPGRPMVEIETFSGRKLVCTEDHPVWDERQGYVRADHLLEASHAVHLRCLRDRGEPVSGSLGSVPEWPLLLPGLFFRWSNRGWKQDVERGDGFEGVRYLQADVLNEAGRGVFSQPEVLFNRMQRQAHQAESQQPVSGMRQDLSLWQRANGSPFLLQGLLQQGSSSADQGGEEWSISHREMGQAVLSRLHEEPQEEDQTQRRVSVRHLLEQRVAVRPPRGRIQDEPRPVEPGDSVFCLPRQRSHEEGSQQEVAQVERVRSARRLPSADWVYNLRVSPGHAYFANGILTHNCDDPTTADQARSEVEREGANTWFFKTFFSRQNDPKKTRILVVQQRLHPKDLSGRILEKNSDLKFEHLCLPMEFSGARKKPPTIIGWEDPRDTEGALLAEDRFSPEEVAIFKAALNADWEAQANQNPKEVGGNLLEPEWFPRWKELPETFDRLFQSWDCALKGEEPGKKRGHAARSFVVGTVWGVKGTRVYLLWVERKKAGILETIEMIKRVSEMWPGAVEKFIEDKANGPAIIETLKGKIHGLIPVQPRGSKYARMAACVPFVRAGQVVLPEDDLFPWVAAYVEELTSFPAFDTDDQVDSTSQGLTELWLTGATGMEYDMGDGEASGVPSDPLAPKGAMADAVKMVGKLAVICQRLMATPSVMRRKKFWDWWGLQSLSVSMDPGTVDPILQSAGDPRRLSIELAAHAYGVSQEALDQALIRDMAGGGGAQALPGGLGLNHDPWGSSL